MLEHDTQHLTSVKLKSEEWVLEQKNSREAKGWFQAEQFKWIDEVRKCRLASTQYRCREILEKKKEELNKKKAELAANKALSGLGATAEKEAEMAAETAAAEPESKAAEAIHR